MRLAVRLKDDAILTSWDLSSGLVGAPSPVELWQAHVSVPLSVGKGVDGELFFPAACA